MITLQEAAHLLRADLAGWRAHHPDASPRELCAALDHRLQALRRQLVLELAPATIGDELIDAAWKTLPADRFTRIGGRTLRLCRDAG